MKSRTGTILLLFIFAIGYQSCDNKLDIAKPEDFFKYIGGDGNQTGVDLVTDDSGNIFILGTTTSNSDGQQLYVVMTSPQGNLLWEKTFGDPGNEEAKDIEMMKDGNLILVANRTDISSNQTDFVIYKLKSADGSIIDTPVIADATNGINDYANSITQITGGFIVSAYTDADGYKSGEVFRFDDSMGRIASWTVETKQTAAGSVKAGYDLVPVKVIEAGDELFYTFGYTNSPILDGDVITDYNFFIIVSGEFNSPSKNFVIMQGPDPASDERLTSARAVPPQSGAGFVLSGYISNAGSSSQDLYVARVVQDLVNLKPSTPSTYLLSDPKTVTSDLAPVSSSGASIFPSTSSGYYLLGTQNQSGNTDIFLTKLDNLLGAAWPDPHSSVSFGGSSDDTPGAVVETSDGRVLVVGTMGLGDLKGQTKIVLMNLSPNGMFGQ